MPKRKEDFFTGEYYHIFNRGVDKRKIFLNKGDLYYFFDTMNISNTDISLDSTQRSKKRKDLKNDLKDSSAIVKIVSYCLLPNHFHLILKQEVEGGISKFMNRLGTSYSQYFNTKYNRTGTLFQGRFKANRLTGEGKLPMSLELTSAYVNLNYKHHNYNIKKDLIKTSIFEYLGEEKGESICNTNEINRIINSIGGIKTYKEWAKVQSKNFIIKHGNDFDDVNFEELK